MANDIYLDYSATTPVNNEILNEYVKNSLLYYGNPNSMHKLGKMTENKMNEAIYSISHELNCYSGELIFTSGASESNAHAIRGVAQAFKKYGNHIITSKLEHKSILEEMKRLEKIGYKIEYVNLLQNGQVDLNDLANKINNDTILVSICGVNSEVGYVQDLNALKKVIENKNTKTIFHSDLTQGLGKIKIDLKPLDLATFSSHKIYAPRGCGILYKKKELLIDKLICGTTANTPYRGGTPNVALICAFDSAIKLANKNLEINNEKCTHLKNEIINNLKKYDIHINSNELCVPQIINISLPTRNTLDFFNKLSDNNVYLSTTSACSSIMHKSIVLNEIYKDNSISTKSLRISISHLTTKEEIRKFLNIFDSIYYE